MFFVTEQVKEGYVAFVFGLKDTENPYPDGTMAHIEWEAGWAIAKSGDAKIHPDEIGKQRSEPFSTDRDKKREYPPISQEEVSNQFDEIAKYFILTEYLTWLETVVDPRVREIIKALDTEEPSGVVGARQEYQGQMEVMLLLKSKDGYDFVDMYTQLCGGPHKLNAEQHRLEAARIWNIFAMSVKNYVETRYPLKGS